MPDHPDHNTENHHLPFADDWAVQNYVGRIVRIARDYEFASFTVGTLLRLDLLYEEATAFKRDLNRRVALGAYAVLPDREPTPGASDVAFLLHYPGRWVDVIPSPLYIYGRYLKFIRDLPHARWLCIRCRGRGCTECGGTGKLFASSVEEIIAAPLLEAFGAGASKMHAAGRQDVDVRMLGSGRPFVIELARPRRRTADLALLQQQINASSEAVEARQLRFASRRIARAVDTARADKTYGAAVAAARAVGADEVARLNSLSGAVVHQQTPRRVVHRRADKVRDRRIRHFSARPAEEGRPSDAFEIELRTETGMYIKELISGDGGRTRPSLSEILGVACTCTALDVLEVHFDLFCHG